MHIRKKRKWGSFFLRLQPAPVSYTHLSYANQYTKPFNEISGDITELQNALACAARIFELIEEEKEIPDASDALTLGEADGRVEDVYKRQAYCA